MVWCNKQYKTFNQETQLERTVLIQGAE